MLFLENCSKASFLQLLILSSNWQLKCIHTQHTNSSPPSLMSPSGCIYKQCSHLYPAFILPSSANQARFICNLTIRQAVYLINLLYLFQILQECDKLELCKVFLHTFLMLLHLFFLLSGQSLQNLQISRFCKRPCRWQQLLRTSVMWWRDGELGVQMGSRGSEWSSAPSNHCHHFFSYYFFRRILSKWVVWKQENSHAWEFFHSDESFKRSQSYLWKCTLWSCKWEFSPGLVSWLYYLM